MLRLAKVIELTGPDNTEYTVRGNLIGHIALIDEKSRSSY